MAKLALIRPAPQPKPAPKPPRHLRPATRRWFTGVVEMFELEDHHVRLLTLAAQAWDRCEQARGASRARFDLQRPLRHAEVGLEFSD